MRIAPETWHLVDQLLRDQWSPEQISGWLSHTQSVQVSHEWIYQYVLRDKLTQGRSTGICGGFSHAPTLRDNYARRDSDRHEQIE